MRCFNGNDSYSIFESLKRQLKDSIAEQKPEDVDKTDRDEWVDYWVNQYTVMPVELYPDHAEYSLDEQMVKTYNTWHRVDWDEPEYFTVAGVKAICRVPYSGTSWFFEMRPSTFTLCGHEADKIVKPNKDGIGYIVFSYETPLGSATPEGIRDYFLDKVQDFTKQIEYCNKDAEKYNASLQQIAETAIDKRIEQIDKYASLRRGLNLPLNLVKDAPLAMPVPLKKKVLKISKPKKIDEPESSYSIDDSTYHHITEIIDSTGTMMERTPSAYSSLEEEQLRDILLTTLNSHYENLATGEAFRKHGKADIQISVDKHAAYIAECKIWGGQKAFTEALKQLFSYTTWRDTKVSIVVFNKKNKNYEALLATVNSVLDAEAINNSRDKHSLWRCKIQNEEDERIMHVTVQFFDLTF